MTNQSLYALVYIVGFIIGLWVLVKVWRAQKNHHGEDRAGTLMTKIEGKTKRSAERAEAKLHNWLDK
jgi:hypothetical protein